MKVGDTYVVRLDEFEVAEAVIESIEDGQAVLVIPATRIIMGVRSSLTAPPERTPEVDRVFGGMVETPDDTPSEAQQQVDSAPAPVAAPAQPAQQAVNVPAPTAPHQGNSSPDEIGNGLRGVELDSSILD